MERYLIDLCGHYEGGTCVNEVIQRARQMSGPLGSGEIGPTFPIGEEQEELDRVCESCTQGIFEIIESQDPTCPVCRNGLWDIEDKIITEGPLDDVEGGRPIFHFDCPQCKKHVYSKANIWG